MSENLLEVSELTVAYRQVVVISGLTLAIAPGQLTCLIGSNGAGKSTLLRALSGMIPSSGGQVTFGGTHITGLAPPDIVELGLVHVPEGRRLFAGMSVRDNLLMGAYARRDGKAALAASLAEVFALFPRLQEREKQDAHTLSGGEQQMCAIGRGLMARPRLLMLDELSLGLAPQMVDELVEALRKVNASGTTILVVEQDVGIALDLAYHGFVLDHGRITLSGSSQDLEQHAGIREAYLGLDAGIISRSL